MIMNWTDIYIKNGCDILSEVLNIDKDQIEFVQVLKNGMTNRSFVFKAFDCSYIVRIPGEGTSQLIDRKHEALVYEAIRGKGFCDDPVFVDPQNGYKITRFLENARVCDPENEEDLIKCMNLLKRFHKMELRVGHCFDLFNQIDYYESLRGDRQSIYKDYYDTKNKVFKLKRYIDMKAKRFCLSHIDAVPDNFLFTAIEPGKEQVQLTDWEYAGMQDVHIDLAMFSIYSGYNKTQADHLIDLYFGISEDEKFKAEACPMETRAKIYCYMAAGGLLWSNWCEYKSMLGISFGEYSLSQYNYAKDFYKYAMDFIEGN